MKDRTCSGLFISYDRPTQMLVVLERKTSEHGTISDQERLRFCFADYDNLDSQVIEQTLGQLVLYSLEKLTPDGLGFGDYSDLLDRISEENIAVFSQGLDMSNPDDQYSLATLMFSRGGRMKSWGMVERAIGLFEQAAVAGHHEAKRFLDEDLPVVRPRMEEKLNKRNLG
ncbi:MAG: hypothetical protein K8F27_05160 [Sulfuricellaceae bacterium]|nr:hypothetical protein [Sulfuricellaceae bacterium]